MSKSLTINNWGNGLGLRITKPIATELGLAAGSEVNVTIENGRLVVSPARRRRSLDEMLAAFDISKHGGEEMAFPPVGAEFGSGTDGEHQVQPSAKRTTVRRRIGVSKKEKATA